jgi:hypothetical protein
MYFELAQNLGISENDKQNMFLKFCSYITGSITPEMMRYLAQKGPVSSSSYEKK